MIVVCNVEITLPKRTPTESQAEPVVAALDTPVCFSTCTCHFVRVEKRNAVMEFFLIDKSPNQHPQIIQYSYCTL